MIGWMEALRHGVAIAVGMSCVALLLICRTRGERIAELTDAVQALEDSVADLKRKEERMLNALSEREAENERLRKETSRMSRRIAELRADAVARDWLDTLVPGSVDGLLRGE